MSPAEQFTGLSPGVVAIRLPELSVIYDKLRELSALYATVRPLKSLPLHLQEHLMKAGPAKRRIVQTSKLDQRLRELAWISALQSIHSFPRRDRLFGFPGVVVDRRLRVIRRFLCEQLGAEEAGLHEHRADAESRDLGGQRFDPALDGELRSSVGGDEFLSGYPGGRRYLHDEAGALPAHERKHGASDVHQTEQIGLDLCPEI